MMVNNQLTIAQLNNLKSTSAEVTSLTQRITDIVFKKKIADFTVEDLRILIGQGEFLPLTIPLALETLTGNPMAEGDFYPGDLLKNVLVIDTTYWSKHPEEKKRLERLLFKNQKLIFEYDVSDDIKRQLKEAIEGLLELT